MNGTQIEEYFNIKDEKRSLRLNTTGKVLAGVTGALSVALTAACFPFVIPALRKHCLPYVPATNTQIKNILTALKASGRGNVVDLGSGDGRIVLEAAKENLTSHGVELNPWLVVYSRLTAFRRGLSADTRFFRSDLWKFSLQPYDNVVIFGVEQMMFDLEKKLLSECKNNCTVIACRFPLPNLIAERIIGQGLDTVWVYIIKHPNPKL